MEKFEELNLELQDKEWPFEYIDRERVTSRGIVYDDAGRFYFCRLDRDDEFGKNILIQTSGGGVEPGEDLAGAVQRELLEELGAETEIVCRLGMVSDYYNLLHRHTCTNFFLCHVLSFGEKHLLDYEIDKFHMETLCLTYDEAVREYERCSETKLGRLIAQRELPFLKYAKQILDEPEQEASAAHDAAAL